MSRDIALTPLTAQAFAPFGEVLDTSGEPDRIINQGLCGRYHDQAHAGLPGRARRDQPVRRRRRAPCP